MTTTEEYTRGWYGDTTNSTGVEETVYNQPHGNNGSLIYKNGEVILNRDESAVY